MKNNFWKSNGKHLNKYTGRFTTQIFQVFRRKHEKMSDTTEKEIFVLVLLIKFGKYKKGT